MKTSNKLFLTATLIVIISLIAYDFALRAEYKKGTYKSRFYGFEKSTAYNGFNAIDNRAANLISIQVEKGNEPGVWVKGVWKDRFNISRKGNALVIEVANKQSTRVSAYDNSITVICPSLKKITSEPYLGKSGQNLRYSRGNTTVSGFDLEKLALTICNGLDLTLQKNKIADLQATVGNATSNEASLTIGSNNQIQNAGINVPGKNKLVIENPGILRRNFTIADSATVTYGGSFLKQMSSKN